MNFLTKISALGVCLTIGLLSSEAMAQTAPLLTLQAAVDSAMANNHLLKVKGLQVQEKEAKEGELAIKKYPSVMVSSTYLYNVNVSDFTIPKGSLGVIPTSGAPVLLPNADINVQPMEHSMFSAGVTVYQPLTQQFKISTGEKIDRADVSIAQLEEQKARLQVAQAVEKLYFGLLINRQQQTESTAKMQLLTLQLNDIETALSAGKTVDVNQIGLQASKSEEAQNLLKLQMQADDYWSDLLRITGIESSNYSLDEPTSMLEEIQSLTSYYEKAMEQNTDIRVAKITEEKAALASKAAKQSYLPDVGIVGGYLYQQGTTLIPQNNPFAGVNLKWNLQDLISNKKVVEQRQFINEQAKENSINTQNQVKSDVEKAYRKMKQLEALIQVAQTSVSYRTADLEMQQNKKTAGLTTEADVLKAEASLAKAQGDLYSALFAYKMSLTDLNIITAE